MNSRSDKFIILRARPDAVIAKRWQDMLTDAEQPTHYVTPDFFSDPFVGSGERFAVLAMSADRVDAALTGLRNERSVTSGLAVRPQICFRSGCDQYSASEAIMNGLGDVATGAELVEIHSWQPIGGFVGRGFGQDVATGGDQVIFLDLTRGPEQIFAEFSSRRRTALRKAMRRGRVETKLLETDSELKELFAVHQDWCRRKGIGPDAADAFSANLTSQYRAVMIAKCNGRVVAGTFLRFCPGGVVEYAANNSLAEYVDERPNELLGWRAVEWACESGFSRMSLGASHPFLARFGGELVSSYRYRLDKTFLKFHNNRERFARLAAKTYFALPEPLRGRIKATIGK
ncbi:MAG: GNAT family N-acetyltransferase [Pyrinomonadaceae bacterium]